MSLFKYAYIYAVIENAVLFLRRRVFITRRDSSEGSVLPNGPVCSFIERGSVRKRERKGGGGNRWKMWPVCNQRGGSNPSRVGLATRIAAILAFGCLLTSLHYSRDARDARENKGKSGKRGIRSCVRSGVSISFLRLFTT